MENSNTKEPEAKPTSPYVGLIPYSSRDAKFFFGRETETEIISANLRSARLTVLYGMSGVGKSSVLQAGVVHNLRELAAEDTKTYGQAEFAVVSYRNWAGDPLKGIARALREAVAQSLGIKAEILEPVPESDDLVKTLQAWSQRYSLELLIILDQFEELFNYLTDKQSKCAIFADELAKAVKAPDLTARFLISLRGDTLSLLDYFKETIPNLLENRLQLYHLNAPKAYNAITKPIAVYNELCQPDENYSIEPELVYKVIEQIEIGRGENDDEKAPVAEGVVKKPGIMDLEETYIETPYLQLVMKRIWREEVEAGSKTLRLTTLTEKLGGTKQIIQTHLNGVLEKFTDEEKSIASKCFKYLVTPMGTKIALTPGALAKELDRNEEKIKNVLELLIKGKPDDGKSLDINLPVSAQQAAIVNEHDEARILRNVEIPVGKKRLAGYEVSHDAYIPAILDWRERYVIGHSVWNQIVRYITIGAPIAAIALVIVVVIFFIYRSSVTGEITNVKKELENVNANRNILANEKTNILFEQVSEKIASNEASENKVNKKETTSAYKEIISILVNLSGTSPTEKDSAIEKFKKMIAEGKVPDEYKDSIIKLVERIDKQKADDLRNVAVSANTNRNTDTKLRNFDRQIKTRVYIHITDEIQREPIKNLYQKSLEDAGYDIPGIENVGNIDIIDTQVRYFREADEKLANEVADIIRQQNVKNVKVQFISGYENSNRIPPKHLEIWFAPDAFADSAEQFAK